MSPIVDTSNENETQNDALAAIAADRANVGDERAACEQVWPLLSVSAERLLVSDAAAIEEHLAACARCRAVALDVWLDGDIAPIAVRAQTEARAVGLPTAKAKSPSRRAWRPRVWLTAAAAAIAVLSVTVAGVRWLGSNRAVVRAGGVKDPDVTAPVAAPLAVVIAYPGTELWIGNDSYVEPPAPPDPSPPADEIRVIGFKYTHGAHDALVSALDDLSRALPAAARVGVLAFDNAQLDVRQALAPARELDGSRVVGPQERYHERIGSVFHEDVLDRAALLVRAVPATRHMVVLITDGCSTRSRSELAAARDRLAAAEIEVRAIVLDVSGDMSLMGGMDCVGPLRGLDPALVRPKNISDLPEAMRSALGV